MKNIINKSQINIKKIIQIIAIIIVIVLIIVIEGCIIRGKIQISPSLDLGFFTIHFYSLFIFLAALVLIVLSHKVLQSKNFEATDIENLVIFTTIMSIIGARLWHLVTDWQLYSENPIEALYIWNGGLGIFGGVIFGFCAILIFCKFKKLPAAEILNVLAFFLPVSQIIGRYGNLLNQEIYGKPTNLIWGLFIRPENRFIEYKLNEFYHPLFLYEQIGNIFLIIVNIYLYKRFRWKGSTFIVSWLIGYGILRFLLEYLRFNHSFYLGFSFNQITSLLLVGSGIVYASISYLNKKNYGKK
jgi:phosphatidylglycerol---prolipoprotein diacylglyceryl transferase